MILSKKTDTNARDSNQDIRNSVIGDPMLTKKSDPGKIGSDRNTPSRKIRSYTKSNLQARRGSHIDENRTVKKRTQMIRSI